MAPQDTQPPVTVSHERVVRASARVLAYRRWNRDDEGSAVFCQLLLWTSDDAREATANRDDQ